MAFISITPTGASVDLIIRAAERNLKQANRKAAREISTKGLRAMRNGAPRMWGRKLAIKSKTSTTPLSVKVLFFPAPKNAGGWAMRESGTRPHIIRPRRRPRAALKIGDQYAKYANHPGSTGEKAWTKAGDRLEDVITPLLEELYGDALEAT